jgi:hypothetical protein
MWEGIKMLPSEQNKNRKPLTVSEVAMADAYIEGRSVHSIAVEVGMAVDAVQKVLNKKHVKEYVKEQINEHYTALKEGRIRILNRIIEDKLKHLEEQYGGDLSKATGKDVVDLIAIMDNMMKEREKKELGLNEGNTYVTLLNQILD